MPLSKLQSDILRLLASHRDPESYVAGSTPLNRDAPRFSDDIDVFHDREERVLQAAEQDAAFLQEHGYILQWLRRSPLIYTVLATCGSETTKLEWVVDSDSRFFPTVRDEVFGYVLHPVDLATNIGSRSLRASRAAGCGGSSDDPRADIAAWRRGVGVGWQNIGIYPGRDHQRNPAHSALYRSRLPACRQRSA